MSCLPEKLDLAITDFEAALAIKGELLPLSSRQLAEAHYKLSIVLDLTSGRLAQAIHHAEKALESVEARLAEMRNAQNGQVPPMLEETKADTKGKGKATAPVIAPKEMVQNMTKNQIEAEIKDLEGLREELALRVCVGCSLKALCLTLDCSGRGDENYTFGRSFECSSASAEGTGYRIRRRSCEGT